MGMDEDIYDIYVAMLKYSASACRLWDDGEIWVQYWENAHFRITRAYRVRGDYLVKVSETTYDPDYPEYYTHDKQEKKMDEDVIPHKLFDGLRSVPNIDYDRSELCISFDVFKNVFKNARSKKYEVVVKNDPVRAKYGFVIIIPLFTSEEKIWYKIDARDLYSGTKLGFVI